MRKKRPSRIELECKCFDFPLIKTIGYDHILRPIPLKVHKHQGYELTFILSGKVCWLFPNIKKNLHLNGNDMAIIQPETSHSGEWNIISSATFLWILMDPSPPASATSNCALQEQDITIINTILAEAGNKSCRMSGEIQALLEMLLTEMQELKKNKKNQLAAASIRSLLSTIILKSAIRFRDQQEISREYQSGISLAIIFMNKNIARDVSVTEIAESAGISVTRFSENFKKEMGISPAQYFSRLKCDKGRLKNNLDF